MLETILQESNAKIIFTDQIEPNAQNNVCVINIAEFFEINLKTQLIFEEIDLQILNDF